jgi:hypothetical protein
MDGAGSLTPLPNRQVVRPGARRLLRSRRMRLAVLSALMSCAVVVPVAGAQLAPGPAPTAPSPVYAHVALRYTAHTPAARTGLAIDIAQRPTAPGVPPAIDRTDVFRLAPGSRIDTGAIARCEASDLALLADGPAACPSASRVGAGTADVAHGTVRTTVGVIAFNADGQVVAVLTHPHAKSVVRVLRAAVTGSRLKLALPGDAVLTRLQLRIAPHGTHARPWARTPAACPQAGRWMLRYAATFDPPVGRQVVDDTTACHG